MNGEPFILCVGGADTGRAPILAALLQDILAQQGFAARIESAGVLGHDEAPPQPEARDALATLGLDIGEHQARSLSDTLVAEATLLLTVDRGVLLVLQSRLADSSRCRSLADLASVQRDIPDPFRMQVGAWVTYAHTMAQMLQAALPQIISLAGFQPNSDAENNLSASGDAENSMSASGTLQRLLMALAEFPELLQWEPTRKRIEYEAEQVVRGDLGPAYVALLRALLAMTPATPSPAQVALIQQATSCLSSGPTRQDLSWLSSQIASWPQ